MKLTKTEVETIARLARLGLTEEEKDKFGDQISSILEYVDQLRAVDTDGVQPINQITGLENALREDEARPIIADVRKELLDAAPATEGDLVKTKAVFE